MSDEPIVEIAGPDAVPRCLAIRREVFVRGMGIPEAIELDGLEDRCTQLLLHRGGLDLATARLRVHDGTAKAERVAVLAEARGSGLGRRLMEALEGEARRRGHGEVLLHAQEAVIPFYEKLGYVPEGERFLEADIPHQAMRKKL